MLLTLFQVVLIFMTTKQIRRHRISEKKKTCVEMSNSDITALNNNTKNEPKMVLEQLQMHRTEGT